MTCVTESDAPPIESIKFNADNVEQTFNHDGESECLNIPPEATSLIVTLSTRLLVKVVNFEFRKETKENWSSNLTLSASRQCRRLIEQEPDLKYQDEPTFDNTRVRLIAEHLNISKVTAGGKQMLIFNCESNEDISITEKKL